MNYKELLKDSGFSDKEILVYSALLENDILPVTDIIRISGLKKGIIYKILYDLEDRNIVQKLIKDKKLYFKVTHPYKLRESFARDLTNAKIKKESFELALPSIIESYKKSHNTPGVMTFTGAEGIKEAYSDTLKEGKEIKAFLCTTSVDKEIYNYLIHKYTPLRVSKKIFAKVITSSGDEQEIKEYLEGSQKSFRRVKLLKDRTLPDGVEIDIYGSRILMVSFKSENDLFAVIIEDSLLSSFLSSVFEIIWEDI